MADKKISALTASTTPLAGTEVLPIVQGGSTVKVSVANLTAGRDTSVKDLNASGNVVSKGTAIFFGDGLDNSAYVYATGGPVHIFANAAATFDFTTAGNLKPLIADRGIDFSVNSNAPGMSSEVLSDYEEGTWTPAVTTSVGSITTITTSGKYTKVGRNVTLTFRLVITDNGTGSGSFNMTGVPFAPSAPDAEAGIGRETGAVGFSCVCSFTSGTTVNLANYLGAYPGGTGYVLVGSFTYLV